MPIEGNPDPIAEVAKVFVDFRTAVDAGVVEPDADEYAKTAIDAYQEAKNPFVPGRFTKTANPLVDDYQLVVCHDGTRQLLQGLFKQYNLELFQIPSSEDDMATFGLRPKDL